MRELFLEFFPNMQNQNFKKHMILNIIQIYIIIILLQKIAIQNFENSEFSIQNSAAKNSYKPLKILRN